MLQNRRYYFKKKKKISLDESLEEINIQQFLIHRFKRKDYFPERKEYEIDEKGGNKILRNSKRGSMLRIQAARAAKRWMARGPHEIENEEYSARNLREIRREIRRALRIFLPPTDFDFPVRHGLRQPIDLPLYSPWTLNSSRFFSAS